MADALLGLTELALVNDQNVRDLGVTDLFDEAPFLNSLAATIASNGTTHKYLKQTGAPVVGFRAANAGLDNTKSADTEVDITLKILDASFNVDVAIANAYRGGPEAYIAREARRHIRAAFFAAEQQIIMGTVGGAAAGFAGLANATTLDGLSDVATVVDAGGTTAATGSSVYLYRSNNDETDVTAVIGQNGEITIGQTVVAPIVDGSGKKFTVYHTPITAWMGLQIGSAYSVVRIANCTADPGKGLTDLLISSALALFPASRQPTGMIMGRRSRMQLQKSRTATNATGAPAPVPMDAFGVPIIATDGIGVTETLLA